MSGIHRTGSAFKGEASFHAYSAPFRSRRRRVPRHSRDRPRRPPTPARAQEAFPEELWSSLSWRNVGPPRGGRSIAAAGSAARPFEYYMGTTGGGLWRTTDGGQNWRPVTDGQINSASIGAVQVCETDPDIVYMGTGETQLRGNIQQGDGAYKSTDGGDTWEHIGLKETQNIARIRIHPENCDVAWAAAFGKHSADNPERGVFKTHRRRARPGAGSCT